MKALLIISIVLLSCSVEASNKSERGNEVEPRGKAKYALIIHFFYVVATKLIVLKMVYGALFFVLIYKGWHFLLWFLHYLKKQKHEHHEYIEDHHFDHGHFDHHDHHDHGHFDHSYGSFDQSYGSFDHQPYGYDKYGYGSDKKRIYDADGSYSVKG
ncbi:hypothetical protein PYW07_007535 [Mythimna separata]|uniref:Uncharacterized protein n=1 Tax=Mythimna separata TaxID=271217 RepID=A0AAD7Z308_MYTSE|nr:hypothetical protein PYW07_007535 [Mythimna separata]